MNKYTMIVFCLLASLASAQLYSVGVQGDVNLRQIDPATAATLSSTPIVGAVNGFNGIAEDPTTGLVYVIHDSGGVRELGLLDIATATLTPIGPFGATLNALAFDSGGNLFGLTGDGDVSGGGTVVTVNKTTGAATVAVALGSSGFGGAMLFDPMSGSLVYWDGCPTSNGALIDPVTLMTSPLPGLPMPNGELRGSTVTAAGGFIANDFTDMLYSFTLVGTTTPIGLLDHVTHGIVEIGGAMPCDGLYPGTGEDLVLTAGANGLTNCSQQTATAGDVLFVRIQSPGGTFNTSSPIITGQLFATGTAAPFIPVFMGDGVWLNPGLNPGPFIAYDGNAPPFNGLGLPPQGLTFQYFVGPFLAGVSVMLNAFAITPLAANNIFVATEGIEIQFI